MRLSRFANVVTIVMATVCPSLAADGPSIIPAPEQFQPQTGVFKLSAKTRVLVGVADPAYQQVGELLGEYLGAAVGAKLKVAQGGPTEDEKDLIVLMPGGPRMAERGAEYYELDVRPDAIIVRAGGSAGAFYAVQTLRQLLPPETLAPGKSAGKPLDIGCLLVKDQPRYSHRGMLLDCGRHFMTPEFVKRYIDLLALHKLNVLHWHLTDDQGWRVEIKKYPKLTEVGAWRKATRDDEQPRDAQGRYGGFYTQDQIRAIVAYAAARHVTIVPEIEMPGHAQAALASYPDLSCTGGPFEVGTQWGVIDDVFCAGNDHTFEFLQDVLSEVLELFPGQFIHVGGDECPKERWKKCAKCQARIQADHLKDEHELQSYFIRRIEKFLNSKGKRLIGWDEILEGGLAPNATVQSWRGMDGAVAAAMAGHDVISSPTSHCYLDYAQSNAPGEPTNMGFIPLQRVYEFEPTPAKLNAEQARHILGLEGNIWTEHAPQLRIDWQVFPRLCALAEIGWSPQPARKWDDFTRRMKTHYRRLDALGVTYFIPPPVFSVAPTAFTDALDVELKTALDGQTIAYTIDGSRPTADEAKAAGAHVHLTHTATIKALAKLPNGRVSMLAEATYKKLVPQDPTFAHSTQPGLHWWLYGGEFNKLPDFNQLKAASEGMAFDKALTDTKNCLVVDKQEKFALRFTGFFEAPKDGVYSFYLRSDDGSRLWIGDDIVVDADGLHAAREAKGSVMLKAGKHPLAIEYFQAGEAKMLELTYDGPGITRGPIPSSMLSYPSSGSTPPTKSPTGHP